MGVIAEVVHQILFEIVVAQHGVIESAVYVDVRFVVQVASQPEDSCLAAVKTGHLNQTVVHHEHSQTVARDGGVYSHVE